MPISIIGFIVLHPYSIYFLIFTCVIGREKNEWKKYDRDYLGGRFSLYYLLLIKYTPSVTKKYEHLVQYRLKYIIEKVRERWKKKVFKILLVENEYDHLVKEKWVFKIRKFIFFRNGGNTISLFSLFSYK